jgi:hypothetical protein
MNSDIERYLDLLNMLHYADDHDKGAIAELLSTMDSVWYNLTDEQQQVVEDYGRLGQSRW